MPNEKDLFYISNWFLDLLESSNRNLTLLSNKIYELNKEEIIRYQFEYQNTILNVYPDDEIKVIFDGQIYMPHYDDRVIFAGWVVSLGDKFIKEILCKPRILTAYFKYYYYSSPHFSDDSTRFWVAGDDENLKKSLPELLAYSIFEKKFDENLWDIVDDLIENDDEFIVDRYRKNESYNIYQRV